MSADLENFIDIIIDISNLAPKQWLPSAEGSEAKSQSIIFAPLVEGTRSYIEKVSNQINGCYENGWFDACAVMIRRLLETLIIEVFEHHKIQAKIQKNGDYFYLKDLISATLAETSWTLGRNTKHALPKLKDIGDKSAHSRRYNAIRHDIDDIKLDLRVILQELLVLANLK